MKADSSSQRSRTVTVKRGSVSVKIYRGKTRGYDTHTLAYYEGGKRVRRTFNTLAEAKTEAEIVATEPAVTKGTEGLIVHLPGGARVEVRDPRQAGLAAELLKALTTTRPC